VRRAKGPPVADESEPLKIDIICKALNIFFIKRYYGQHQRFVNIQTIIIGSVIGVNMTCHYTNVYQ
jgi:hypothetical protein